MQTLIWKTLSPTQQADVLTRPALSDEADIGAVNKLGKLPKAAREYLEAIQDLLERPIELVSVGKERSQTIVIN